MYNEDHRNQSRMSWRYTYKGRELLPHARRKFVEYQTRETAARERMAVMIKDPSTFNDDRELQAVKAEIDRLSATREQLKVMVGEFRRAPEKEHTMHLSDVVFFGIHLADTFVGLEAVGAAWEHVEQLRTQLSRTRKELQRCLDRQEQIIGKTLRYLGHEGGEASLRERFAGVVDRLQDQVEALEAKLEVLEEEHQAARQAGLEALEALQIPPFRLGETDG